MPKFTPLRERILVARETLDSAELTRIKREIVDAHKVSGRKIVATARRLGINQMTLRRIAADLGIEGDLGIDRSRGEPSLFFARAHAAVETDDKATVAKMRKQVLEALSRARNGGDAGAAKILGVSTWVFKKVVDVLGISGEVDRQFPGKYSLLGERVLVAQKTNNVDDLRRIQLEIVDAYQAAGNDIEKASDALGVTSTTLRRIVESLGLGKALGVGEHRVEHVLLMSRLRVAIDAGDMDEIERIQGQVLRAIKRARGSLKNAAKAMGLGEASLRQVLEELRITDDIREQFPGQGKERRLTARVNGKDVTLSVSGWARARKMNRTTIIERLRRGYTPEQAIEPKDFREG